MTVPETTDQTSFFMRVRNRFRYGLATQEFLDRLASNLGLLIYPYYLVREQVRSGIKLEAGGNDDDFQIRDLAEDDMEQVATHGARRRSADILVAKLRSGSRCLGFFVNGNLAAYTWFRIDRAPVPVWMNDLFQLKADEAYLFDAYVFPAYRGRRLAPLVRYHAYVELQKLGRHRLYSITLAFNSASRRFKRKLLAEEIELRLLLGIKKWKAIDVRIRAFDYPPRALWGLALGRRQAVELERS